MHVRIYILCYQLVAISLELDVLSITIVCRVLGSEFRSMVIVGVTLLEKGDLGFHEAHSVHIRKHSLQVLGFKEGGKGYFRDP